MVQFNKKYLEFHEKLKIKIFGTVESYCMKTLRMKYPMGLQNYYEKVKIITTKHLFKRQPHKMVKQTKEIPRQIADELFKCVWPFCGVGA